MASRKSDEQVFSNLIDFYTHSMIIIADLDENIFHKKIHLSLAHTQFILNKILLTQWFPICIGIIIAVNYFTAMVYWHFVGHDWLYAFFIMVACLTTIISSSFYILSANINICWFILQTFDFWYKTYNIILGAISNYFINFYCKETVISTNLAILFACATLFISDAILISNKSKNILITVMVCIMVFSVIYAYFVAPDVYWNPFNSKISKISIKSTMISSYINLVVFVLKPIFSQIGRYCRKVILYNSCKFSKSSNSDIDNRLKQRLTIS